MTPPVSYNERSWAIDLIAHIKRCAPGSNRAIKDAGEDQFTVAALALRNISDDRLLDPCCGSGAIARAALEQKLEAGVQPHQAATTVFASDLDPKAVQLAALARVKPSLMHTLRGLFRKDAFRLRPDGEDTFHHASDGSSLAERRGSLDAMAGNLPFVSQVGRQRYTEGTNAVNTLPGSDPVQMSGRSGLAAYLPFALHCLLATGGRLVIIISNAWLGTNWGDAFWAHFPRGYRIRSIVTSGSGRWFQNSGALTSLLVMEKREAAGESEEAIDFIVLKRPLEELADSLEAIAVTRAQIELGQAHDGAVSIRSVSRSEPDRLAAQGLRRSAHFVDCNCTREMPMVPLRNLCTALPEARKRLDATFAFYNHHRPRQKPQYRSPAAINYELDGASPTVPPINATSDCPLGPTHPATAYNLGIPLPKMGRKMVQRSGYTSSGWFQPSSSMQKQSEGIRRDKVWLAMRDAADDSNRIHRRIATSLSDGQPSLRSGDIDQHDIATQCNAFKPWEGKAP